MSEKNSILVFNADEHPTNFVIGSPGFGKALFGNNIANFINAFTELNLKGNDGLDEKRLKSIMKETAETDLNLSYIEAVFEDVVKLLEDSGRIKIEQRNDFRVFYLVSLSK